jgi:hypothetical protein
MRSTRRGRLDYNRCNRQRCSAKALDADATKAAIAGNRADYDRIRDEQRALRDSPLCADSVEKVEIYWRWQRLGDAAIC